MLEGRRRGWGGEVNTYIFLFDVAGSSFFSVALSRYNFSSFFSHVPHIYSYVRAKGSFFLLEYSSL